MIPSLDPLNQNRNIAKMMEPNWVGIEGSAGHIVCLTYDTSDETSGIVQYTNMEPLVIVVSLIAHEFI